MYIGKVIGTAVATKKDARLIGSKLLIITPLERNGYSPIEISVAVDPVGAGIGEVVLVTEGSSARQAVNNVKCPIDAAVVGIIDTMEINDAQQ